MTDIMMKYRQFIAENFPRNIQEIKFNGVRGWLYTLTNESSNEFKIFVYNDNNRYQVVVAFPEDAVNYSLEDIYTSNDSCIIYNSENGFSILEEAFEVSKLRAMFAIQEKPSLDETTLPDYDEESFWQKLSTNAFKAGKDVVEKALTLYYASRSDNFPTWAKTTVYSSLAYFILPVDLIPDVIPAAGYTDDLIVLLSALSILEIHVTPEHKETAKNKLRQWFGSNEE